MGGSCCKPACIDHESMRHPHGDWGTPEFPVRGQAGAVMETWVPGVHDVEFREDDGKTYAMVALRADQLMKIHHAPAHQAA